MNNRLKFFFDFSKREQIAIITLIACFLIVLLFNSWMPGLIQKSYVPVADLDSLVQLYENFVVEKEELAPRSTRKGFETLQPEQSTKVAKLNPFPFNPNRLDESVWRKIGLTERQIKNIQNYEAKGGKFVIKNDLRRLFTISDEEFEILEPFIQLPENREAAADARKMDATEAAPAEKSVSKSDVFEGIVELNAADSASLTALPGIRPWTAHRIIRHRSALGGFISVSQLLEVHGFDSVLFRRVELHLEVNPDLIQKTAINELSFKEILRHPYIDFEKTKSIITHRERRGLIRSEEELLKLQGFTIADIEKLRPYIRF